MDSTIITGGLLTSETFCKLMDWKPKTLYMKVTSGADLPASIKIGNKRFFRGSVVNAWLLSKEKNTWIKA